jgi:hypothetical protein
MRSWVAVLVLMAVLVIFAAPTFTLPRTTLDSLKFSDSILWLLAAVVVLFQQLPLPELSSTVTPLALPELPIRQIVRSAVLIC